MKFAIVHTSNEILIISIKLGCGISEGDCAVAAVAALRARFAIWPPLFARRTAEELIKCLVSERNAIRRWKPPE